MDNFLAEDQRTIHLGNGGLHGLALSLIITKADRLPVANADGIQGPAADLAEELSCDFHMASSMLGSSMEGKHSSDGYDLMIPGLMAAIGQKVSGAWQPKTPLR
jgi:hypothetical protein